MFFTVDKQTLEDLNLLGKYKSDSIFNVFNNTRTRGGERLLEQMFQTPFTDAAAINKRGEIFRYFQEKNVRFPIEKELFDSVDHYLSNPGHPNRIVACLNTCRRKFLNYIATDKEYALLYAGLLDTIEFLNAINDFNTSMGKGDHSSVYAGVLYETDQLLHDKQLIWALQERGAKELSLLKMIKYDHLLRATCQSKLKRLMEIIYYTDVYITVARVANERGFTKAHAVPVEKGKNHIDLVEVFHPRLEGAVANTVHVDHDNNVIFLTGANMAGKSTFMKSFSIAVYLAHMGFPVAAQKMEFSVLDGLYTSINVSDNLNMGYSHFYAEVLRVKNVAEEVSREKNLVIIFDELFKGTNVKDAYDATVAVTKAFAAHRNCMFIISTHIIEAGHALTEVCDNFKFVFFPTVMKGSIPTYTYQLQPGITNDRHGMMIINNEHIVDIIRGNNPRGRVQSAI